MHLLCVMVSLWRIRVTEPGGHAAGRRWTGRCYAHLLLPVPFLTRPAIALFDEAVGADDGWTPAAADDPGGVALSRTWRRPSPAPSDELLLTVLGWYPLLVTVGTTGRGSAGGARSARRAVHRTITATLSVDGRWVPDRELPHRIAAGRDRAAAAFRSHAAAADRRAELAGRSCASCRASTGYQATHCDRCGRRFSTAEDSDRDRTYRRAVELLAGHARDLEHLGRDRAMRPPPGRVDADVADRPVEVS